MKKLLLSLMTVLMAGAAQASLPFVTTSSPTTLPIHWYQLKVGDGEKYVTYDPNAYVGQRVKITTTASTNDNYLWCFVKISSGKILLYNRAAKQYLVGAQFYSSDINSSLICFVKEEENGYFYITYYHDGDHYTYYLCEYIGDGVDIFQSSGRYYATKFRVVEIEVEGDDLVAGDVNGDSVVSGADVTALYNVLLDGATPAGNADVNGDSVVSGADVTALYNILLGS
ncbi:MAG: dockerin type I repeat-containing protein [Muribaculaceae bacterium]|nr:dockerin type I repeat-containing protein [Muribaculaceae bacterium]